MCLPAWLEAASAPAGMFSGTPALHEYWMMRKVNACSADTCTVLLLGRISMGLHVHLVKGAACRSYAAFPEYLLCWWPFC
jgi:hypothetical protein